VKLKPCKYFRNYKKKTIIIIDEKQLYSKILGLMQPQTDNQKEILVGMARSVHV